MLSALRPKNVVVLSIAVALLGMGCGADSNRGEAPAVSVTRSRSEVIACGTYSSVDENGAPTTVESMYVLPAINRKLKHYPALASAAGLSSVSDCSGSRAFIKAYVAFAKDHPGFDADEPLEGVPENLPPKPVGFSPQFERAKIKNGARVQSRPVVSIDYLPQPRSAPDGGTAHPKHCTGTFIAKGWIATAAHCLAASPNPDDPNNPEWHGWYRWQINFGDSTGAPFGTLTTLALQFPDPRFMTFDPDLESITLADRDFALLYVSDVDEDRFLPANANDGSSSLISLVAPDESRTATMYGWGRPTPYFLRTGTLPPIQNASLGFVATMTSSTQALPCAGDSGGPAVQTLAIGSPGSQTNQPVVIGVYNGGTTFLNPNAPDGGVVCASPGDVNQWARIDVEIDWIEKAMRFENGPNFSCTRVLAGTVPGAVAKCWGATCSQDADCVPGSYCSRPGSALTPPCPVCGSDFFQSCGCVIGQCLPLN